MIPTLVDTDILSRFFRNDPKVVEQMTTYVGEHGVVSLSIITYYEVLSGLLHRDAGRQLNAFLAFSSLHRVLPLTQTAADHAARLYALTRKEGTPIDDIDLLIAGIALANGMAIATHNTAHFGKLPGVIVQDWSL
ncbi:MAG: PIN domain-containing protein [Leptospirales bacterium]